MKKLIHLIPIAFIIFFNSCNSNKKENNIQKNQTVDNYSKIDFSGHTLFKVIETDSGRVLYKPCGANVEKFKIYSDSIFHNLGQEYYTLNISSKEVLENEITYRLIYKYNSEKPENSDSILKIRPLDKNQKFWKINNDLYIDSVFVNTIKTVKELPCDEECYDCPEAKDVLLNLKSNNHLVGKWVVNSCESPIGITINKKGDMVICVDPNQYYIHLSNINGGTKYKLNRFEGIGS